MIDNKGVFINMEFFDVVDEKGNKTGEVVEREVAHKQGICHRVVQVWLVNSQKQVLIQKRSATKDSYPNKWYVSLGGHIESGEDNISAIIREFLEELGLDVSNHLDKLDYLFTFKEIEYLNDGEFIDNEFYDVYVLNLDIEVENLKLQEEEVSEVKFIDYEDFKEAIIQKNEEFWIHEEGFYRLLEKFDQIL